jgi:CheY-like chemotaxis protein
MAPHLNFEVVPLSEVPTVELNDPGEHKDRRIEGPIVLVVDDEPLVADSLAAILSFAGYAVVTAYGGPHALELAISIRPALLISDVAMPQMNGVELAMAVLKNSPDCGILLFSGHATARDLAPARAAGHDFTLLAKPLHPKEMLQHVSRSLRGLERAMSTANMGQVITQDLFAESD